MQPAAKKRLKRVGLVILCSAVFIPVAAYFVGSTVIGPYEGDGGLPGYLGTIYLSAGRGERAALTLLTAPVLIVVSWSLALWLLRRKPGEKRDRKQADRQHRAARHRG